MLLNIPPVTMLLSDTNAAPLIRSVKVRLSEPSTQYNRLGQINPRKHSEFKLKNTINFAKQGILALIGTWMDRRLSDHFHMMLVNSDETKAKLHQRGSNFIRVQTSLWPEFSHNLHQVWHVSDKGDLKHSLNQCGRKAFLPLSATFKLWHLITCCADSRKQQGYKRDINTDTKK